MSTLKVNTLQNTSGVEVYTAKAWVNFNGTGTVAIRASGNVSSITDNGAGDYTVNFTNAMPDANYSSLLTTGGGGVQSTTVADNTTARTTTAFRMYVLTTAGGLTDSAFISVAIFR